MEANRLPHALQDGALQVVEQYDPWDGGELLEGRLVSPQKVRELLAEEEAQEDRPGPGEHHHEAQKRSLGPTYFCDRYDARKSVVVTTNLEFGRWVEVSKSKEMTVALLDRLTHRCEVVVMAGKSKRYEESMELQRQRRAKRGKEVAKA